MSFLEDAIKRGNTLYSHQLQVIRMLDDIGDTHRNYLIMLPPQSGKSTIGDWLGRYVSKMLFTLPSMVSYNNSINFGVRLVKNWKQYDPIEKENHSTLRETKYLIVDDIIKNKEEAQSIQLQYNMREWFKTIPSKTRVVCLLSRWTKNDIGGWILNNAPGEWAILRIPAIKNGVSYCEELFSLERLQEIKQSLGSKDWEALYQQHPIE